MSTPFAPWVAGSAAPKFYHTPLPKRSVNLQIVPSLPECDGSGEAIETTVVDTQRNYEGILVVGIKVMLALILFCSVALIGLGIGFALKGDAQAIIVQPGDSLYSIAASIPNAPSLTLTVDDIRSLNALDSDVLQAGQQLILPEY